MKFNSAYTFKRKDHVISEKNDAPSLTVPDEALPLKTLLQRHTRGMDVTMFQGVYSMNNDDDFANILPEFDKMDRIEKLHFSAELRDIIVKKREELGKIQKAKFDEKAKKEIQEAAEELAARKLAEMQGQEENP